VTPRRGFRVAVIVVSVAAAAAGSVLLVMHDRGGKVTTHGVSATLSVSGRPGWVAAGNDALWVALTDPRMPVRDSPLLRLNLASGAVQKRIIIGGQASYLTHVGNRLLASVDHVGGVGLGPGLVIAFDWRSGRVIERRQFPAAMGQLAASGRDLWLLERKPAALLRLDSLTLVPKEAPFYLGGGSTGAIAVDGDIVWVTEPDQGDVMRFAPNTHSVKTIHVGGSPVGIAVAAGRIWAIDADRRELLRLDRGTGRPVGRPLAVGRGAAWLASAGRYLFVGNTRDGTATRVDARSGKIAGPPIRVAQPAGPAAPPLVVEPAGDSVWVSSFASSSVTRIGVTPGAARPRAVVATSRPSTRGGGKPLRRAGSIVATIPLTNARVDFGGGPVVAGEGAVWAVSIHDGTMLRINPVGNAVVARIRLPPPEETAAGNGGIWLTYPSTNTVVRLDPATGKATATINVGPQPSGIALSPGALWVADAGGPSISRIDPATNRVTATIRVGPKSACCAEHMSLTAVPGAIWAAVPNANQLVRVDPKTLKVVRRITLPFGPCAFLIVAATRIWSAGGSCADIVGGINPTTGRVTTLVYEPHAVGLAFAGGSLWAAVIDSGNLDRIDPRTGHVSGRLHIAGTPVRLAVGFGSVWVNDDTGRVLRVDPG